MSFVFLSPLTKYPPVIYPPHCIPLSFYPLVSKFQYIPSFQYILLIVSPTHTETLTLVIISPLSIHPPHLYPPGQTHLTQSQACKGTTTRCPRKIAFLQFIIVQENSFSPVQYSVIVSLLWVDCDIFIFFWLIVILLMSIVKKDSIHKLFNNKLLAKLGLL